MFPLNRSKFTMVTIQKYTQPISVVSGNGLMQAKREREEKEWEKDADGKQKNELLPCSMCNMRMVYI